MTIVDVTMPFENKYEAFEDARREKRAKYDHMKRHFEEEGFEVFLEGFAVGPLGGWDPANEHTMNRLGISCKYSGLMRKLMCSDAIKWSRDIYVEHVTGVRQYKAPGPDGDEA